jgi:hypothetical protein
MKVLHYNLYNNSNIGMCNVLMSIENAITIALLTKREKIVFYGKEKLFNSKDKTLFDLYNINFNYELANSNDIDSSIISLPCNFHNTCLYYKERPSNDFVNKRIHLVDLFDYEGFEEFRTLDNQTLAFYSYLIYFGTKRDVMIGAIKNTVVPKQIYVDIADSYVNAIHSSYPNGFNSLHIRRGDYLYTDNENKNITPLMLADAIKGQFDSKDLLVINTDEKDLSYFDEVKKHIPNIWFIDNSIVEAYKTLDTAEIGLISLLIASNSKEFVGTLYSTYTAYIQRYRLYRGLDEKFKYAYSQKKDLTLVNNRMKSGSFGEHTWNRCNLSEELRAISFWFREWEECYPVSRGTAQQSVRLFPDFLTNEECQYFINKMRFDEKEFYSNEKRNRTTFQIDNDPKLKVIVEKACKLLGYDYNNIENSFQLFAQYEGGQTYSHVDSVHEDYQGKRIASILFYLNDDFDGSYIDFAYLGVRVKPKAGTMIAYPLLNEFNEQDKRWTHAASLITKGTKYMCYFSLKERPFKQ